jgi:class 3 adenylate cyclase
MLAFDPQPTFTYRLEDEPRLAEERQVERATDPPAWVEPRNDRELHPRRPLGEYLVEGIQGSSRAMASLWEVFSLFPDAIQSHRLTTPPLQAERPQLTVMFVDLVSSTELATQLDPEDMARVICTYRDTCTKAVERWGGHVAQHRGDGVLANFGWPQAHEGEAERAVRAGLEVAERVAKLDTPAGKSLAARVGIATGLVVVGDLLGEGAAQEHDVVGETPNLAARLQALAAPGRVVISQATGRLLGGLFELVDLGASRLKGFAEPLSAWRVEGEGRAEGRFEALHGKHLTPLVGREHELGILLERWARAKDGEGQVVLITGLPGIGKRDPDASRAPRRRSVHAAQ